MIWLRVDTHLVLYYNAITHLAVVRCGRDDATQVHACLTFLTEAQHQDTKFRTVVVCGTHSQRHGR